MRSAVVVGPGPRAYFGDLESNVYALDANTGKLIWQKKLDDQPFTRITGTPKLVRRQTVRAHRVAGRECRARIRNMPAARSAATWWRSMPRPARKIWRTYTTPEPKPTKVGSTGVQYYGPSGATIWSSPTIDLKRKLLYVATGNGYSDPPM